MCPLTQMIMEIARQFRSTGTSRKDSPVSVEAEIAGMSSALARTLERSRDLTLFLCGDVMTGRGVDRGGRSLQWRARSGSRSRSREPTG
jgi:hypothetical protein